MKLLGAVNNTIYICWILKVNSYDSSIGKGDDKDVIRNLSSNEVGSYRELELHLSDIEDGKRALVEIMKISSGYIAVRWVEIHPSRAGALLHLPPG
jgi:hypothetical protein